MNSGCVLDGNTNDGGFLLVTFCDPLKPEKQVSVHVVILQILLTLCSLAFG